MLNFYGEKLSEIFPTPKLENYPQLAACDFLLNKFTITFNLWMYLLHHLLENLPCHDRNPLNMDPKTT